MTAVGKGTTGMLLLSGLTLATLLLALPLAGQEPTGPPAYYFISESTVSGADARAWAEGAALTARAHAKHPKGNSWVTHRKMTGGPEKKVHIFFPLERLADLDAWESNRGIVMETLCKDQGRLTLEDFELATDSGERILSYSAALSRPWPDFRAPKYAWVIELRVDDGKMTEYTALAKRLLRAQEQHENGGYWVTYGNAIGGDSSELLSFYGFDQFAEIDSWPSRREVLSAALGDEEEARLAAALEAITETRTSLWNLEPELSQLESE